MDNDKVARQVANEFANAGTAAQEAAWEAQSYWANMRRPSMMLKPRLEIDGKSWRAVHGGDLRGSGMVAFGNSPEEAYLNFDKKWSEKLTSECSTCHRWGLSIDEKERQAEESVRKCHVVGKNTQHDEICRNFSPLKEEKIKENCANCHRWGLLKRGRMAPRDESNKCSLHGWTHGGLNCSDSHRDFILLKEG